MSQEKFVELQKELFGLFKLGNFDGVLALIQKAEADFPERLDKTFFWKACVYSLQDKPEDALKALSDGLQKGVWWNPHTLTSDPDLKILQHLEEFHSIVQKCGEIFQNQGHQTRAQLFTFGNRHSEIGIFALHWRSSNANDFAPYWLGTQDYFFGFPQSSQVYGYHSYCWDKEEIALKDIKSTYKEFKEKGNTKHDILAGASQGGKLTIELGLSDSDFKGFISIIPSLKDVSSIENLLKSKKITNVKGCIITGDQDPFYHKALELKPILDAHGVPCKLIVIEGLGHSFPGDFTDLLADAVDFILQPE